MASRFTTAGPAVADGTRLWLDVEVGFEHTVGEDGVVTLRRDDDGELVARTYRLPMVVTARDAIEATNRVVGALAKFGETLDSVSTGAYRVDVHEDVMLTLISAMLGEPTVLAIAKDPTVAPADFEALMEHLLEVWGFDVLLDDLFGDAGGALDPKD
jgi:hypothetical protein